MFTLPRYYYSTVYVSAIQIVGKYDKLTKVVSSVVRGVNHLKLLKVAIIVFFFLNLPTSDFFLRE